MNRHELECAYYCAVEVLNNRRLRGQAIPDWLKRYHDRVDAAWLTASAHGPETGSTAWESPTIGVAEMAALLGVSPRHVRRIADTLGGRRVSGTWVFNRATAEGHRKESV